jgi:hypothetical protein
MNFHTRRTKKMLGKMAKHLVTKLEFASVHINTPCSTTLTDPGTNRIIGYIDYKEGYFCVDLNFVGNGVTKWLDYEAAEYYALAAFLEHQAMDRELVEDSLDTKQGELDHEQVD